MKGDNEVGSLQAPDVARACAVVQHLLATGGQEARRGVDPRVGHGWTAGIVHHAQAAANEIQRRVSECRCHRQDLILGDRSSKCPCGPVRGAQARRAGHSAIPGMTMSPSRNIRVGLSKIILETARLKADLVDSQRPWRCDSAGLKRHPSPALSEGSISVDRGFVQGSSFELSHHQPVYAHCHWIWL